MVRRRGALGPGVGGGRRVGTVEVVGGGVPTLPVSFWEAKRAGDGRLKSRGPRRARRGAAAHCAPHAARSVAEEPRPRSVDASLRGPAACPL